VAKDTTLSVLIGTLGTEPQVIIPSLWALRNALGMSVYPTEMLHIISTSGREFADPENLRAIKANFRTQYPMELRSEERKTLRYVVRNAGTLRDIVTAVKKCPNTVKHQIQGIYQKNQGRPGVPEFGD